MNPSDEFNSMVNARSIQRVAEACKDFEPIQSFTLTETEAKGVEITALQSIAISLKRIADKLELAQKQPVIMTADEALKFYKERDGT